MSHFESKAQALDFFEKEKANYLALAREVAEKLATFNSWITIDQVREECPPPPTLTSNKVLGAVFNTEKWERVGYEPTKIKTSHGRIVTRWSLKPEYRKPVSHYASQTSFL